MTDEEKTAEPDVTAQELKEALCVPPPTFCAEAVQFAMEHPKLGRDVSLGILEEALTEARAGRDDELGFGPLYASSLLGYHKDERALDLFSSFSRLPDGGEHIIGDLITEEMCAILWSVCGGDAERLLDILDHPDTETYWRTAAMSAISIGVAEGVLDREEMLQVLSQRLETMVDAGPPWSLKVSQTASWLACELVSLGLGKDPSLLDRAYELGLFDGLIIYPEDWHEHAPLTHEEALKDIRRRIGFRYPVDPMRLGRWDCFNERPTVQPMALEQKKAKANQRIKARAKGKASRKSRKKNRRKK